jgi:subtilisin family serine protease
MLQAHKDGGTWNATFFSYESPQSDFSFKKSMRVCFIADIISASIGGPGGWGQGEELLTTVNKLVQEKGAIIIVAAGNEGSVSEPQNPRDFPQVFVNPVGNCRRDCFLGTVQRQQRMLYQLVRWRHNR